MNPLFDHAIMSIHQYAVNVPSWNYIANVDLYSGCSNCQQQQQRDHLKTHLTRSWRRVDLCVHNE
eukprot:m.62772 g.62772  ORF g.62772 m.62772 type:complete len:65 (-) comp23198_c0_seq2:632-826(-)